MNVQLVPVVPVDPVDPVTPLDVITYPVIALPFVVAGAFQETVTIDPIALAVTPWGALGGISESAVITIDAPMPNVVTGVNVKVSYPLTPLYNMGEVVIPVIFVEPIPSIAESVYEIIKLGNCVGEGNHEINTPSLVTIVVQIGGGNNNTSCAVVNAKICELNSELIWERVSATICAGVNAEICAGVNAEICAVGINAICAVGINAICAGVNNAYWLDVNDVIIILARAVIWLLVNDTCMDELTTGIPVAFVDIA